MGAWCEKNLVDVVVVLHHHHAEIAIPHVRDGDRRPCRGIDDRGAVNRILVHPDDGLVVQIKCANGEMKKSIHSDQLGDVVEGQVRFRDFVIFLGDRDQRGCCISLLDGFFRRRGRRLLRAGGQREHHSGCE